MPDPSSLRWPTNRHRGSAFLCVYLPTWSADRHLRRQRDRRGWPRFLLLAESTGGRRLVAGACRASIAEGVRVGMTIAHATALLPAMPRVLEHEPAHDVSALTRLGRWAMRFTPRVAVDAPDGLILDVAGCERLYGGLLPIARQVRQSLGLLRIKARVAVAPTVGLAWGLARFGDEGVCEDPSDLLDLPTAALRIESDVVAALAEVGVDRIGQLVDIPRSEIARRFGGGGDDVLLRLDQATGEAVEPRDWLRYHETLRVSFRFAGPATQHEAVEQTVRQLVGELCDRLGREESAARRVTLEIERLDVDLGPSFANESITLAAATRDVRHLWNVLRPNVESLHMGRGVEALSLAADRVIRLPHGQARLDRERDTSRDEHDIGRLIDLLQGRLGRENVTRPEATPTHVPEAAYRLRPAGETRLHQTPKSSPATAAVGDRPTQLLDPAEPADVAFLRPEGPLATLRWRGESWSIITTVGPERIGRRWWQVDLSRRSLDVRDYYKLQCEGGLWLWVYRTRSLGNRVSKWFVHGVWA
ncbi:MAG: DNA polymerase Y family protein [Planctomycetota bacterium]